MWGVSGVGWQCLYLLFLIEKVILTKSKILKIKRSVIENDKNFGLDFVGRGSESG